jgi:hypothetical protein
MIAYITCTEVEVEPLIEYVSQQKSRLVINLTQQVH